MSTRRSFSLPLAFLTLTACATQQVSQAPAPLKPSGGPDVSIRVGYTGGLIHRNITAYFRTEANSYVLVGHLGGDGVIRVLYPEIPRVPGFVRGKKSYSTEAFSAQFDGIPSLFSYTMSPYRSLSSLHDSYDGRGHGYVFVIASTRPLRTGALDDDGAWLDWEVADYSRTYDPRYAIRDFAAAIAPGDEYTLRFASSFTSSHYDAYASSAWDCAMLTSLGFSYSPFWNGWGGMDYMPLSFWRSGTTYGSCGYRSVSRYAWVNGSNIDRGVGLPVVTPAPTTPSEPAPDLDRPGRRGLGPRTGETTRELTATSLGLVQRTIPTERTEIIVHRTADRPTSDRARPNPREARDLTTRVAQERRAERARDPAPASPRQPTERRSEPARAESPRSSASEPRSSGETRSSSGGSRDTGRAASPRSGRRPDGQ